MRAGSITSPNEHTAVLAVLKPQVALPESLFNYPTAILHPALLENGGDFSKWPFGTGPYELVELSVGDRCILR